MSAIEIASPLDKLGACSDEQKKLSWQDSLPVQRLLDVISSILAEEYVRIVKQNPEVFSKIASPPSGVRNDGGVDSRLRGNDNERQK